MKNKTIVMLISAILALSVLPGCGGKAPGGSQPADSPAQEASGGDVAASDTASDSDALRAVALSPADCEIIAAIGMVDILVGRGEYCDYPAEILDIPMVHSGSEANIEQIIALEPQVVFLSEMNHSPDQIKAMEAAGIRVVATDAQDIEGVYAVIERIGGILDKDSEARSLIDSMEARLAEVGRRASGKTGGSVYFEVSPLEWGLWTAGDGTFMNEIGTLVGLSNVFPDVQGWAQISQEQVIERNPDHIVTVTMFFGEGPLPQEEIMSREGWQDIEAVKNGSVLSVDNDKITRPGPRLAEAAEELFALIYG